MAGLIVSAGIVGGELIIGLSDGTIIRAGTVQGPQGLQGPVGPMGATGRPGVDGNTVLTSNGRPAPDLGRDGDWCIDRVNYEIFHKENGRWGKGQPLLVGGQLGGLDQGGKQVKGAPRFFPMGAASATVSAGPAQTAGLNPIIIHQQPLKAGAPVIDPVTNTVTTAAVWTDVAIDSQDDGDAFIVDIAAEGPAGSVLIEVAVMRDQAKRTGYSQVYEVKTGAPPILTFDAYSAPNGRLALRMYSSENLINVRGRILFI